MRYLVVLMLLCVLPLHAQEKSRSTQGLTSDQLQKIALQELQERVFALQLENAQLRAALADREARLAKTTLTEQETQLEAARKTLERELVAALGGNFERGDRLDWEKKVLKVAQNQDNPQAKKSGPPEKQ